MDEAVLCAYILDVRLYDDRRAVAPTKSGLSQGEEVQEPFIHRVEDVKCPPYVDIIRFVQDHQKTVCRASTSQSSFSGGQVDLICVGFSEGTSHSLMDKDGICCFWTIADVALQAVDADQHGYSHLSTVDEIAVVQLCLAERNRKASGVFEACINDALSARNRITQRRLQAIDDQLCSRTQPAACHVDVPPSPDLYQTRDEDDILIDDYEAYLCRCNVVDSVRLLSLLITTGDRRRREKNLCSKTPTCLDADFLLLLHSPIDPVQRRMLEFILTNKSTYIVSTLPNAMKQSNNLVDGDRLEINVAEGSLSDVISDSSKQSETQLNGNFLSMPTELELHMERVIMAYLRLLLNTRDELALAIALGNMVNGFSHEAFTAMRRMTKASGSLSMYQTAMSFVMKVRLGGKSYAPNAGCFVKYLPELSTFMTVMNKIQNALEEEADSAASFKRILNVLKVHLVKTCCAKMCVTGLNKALQSMDKLAEDVIKNQIASGGCETIQFFQRLLNRHAVRVSLLHSTQVSSVDVVSNQNSPIRIPSILSQFRSPPNVSPIKPPHMKRKRKDTDVNSVLVCHNPNIRKSPSSIHGRVCHVSSRTPKVGSRPDDVIENKENCTVVMETNGSQEKNVKRCRKEIFCSVVGGKLAKSGVPAPATDSTSRSRRKPFSSRPTSTAKTKASKPLLKGQQLMTRFIQGL